MMVSHLNSTLHYLQWVVFQFLGSMNRKQWQWAVVGAAILILSLHHPRVKVQSMYRIESVFPNTTFVSITLELCIYIIWCSTISICRRYDKKARRSTHSCSHSQSPPLKSTSSRYVLFRISFSQCYTLYPLHLNCTFIVYMELNYFNLQEEW